MEFEICDTDTFWRLEVGNTLLLWQQGEAEKEKKMEKLHWAEGEEKDSELTELLTRLFKQNKRSKQKKKARNKDSFSRESLRIVSKPGARSLLC